MQIYDYYSFTGITGWPNLNICKVLMLSLYNRLAGPAESLGRPWLGQGFPVWSSWDVCSAVGVCGSQEWFVLNSYYSM